MLINSSLLIVIVSGNMPKMLERVEIEEPHMATTIPRRNESLSIVPVRSSADVAASSIAATRENLSLSKSNHVSFSDAATQNTVARNLNLHGLNSDLGQNPFASRLLRALE